MNGCFQAHQQAGEGAFTAAACAQQAKALAREQVEVQAFEHLHAVAFAEHSASGVTMVQIAYLNKRHGVQVSRVNAWCAASSVRASSLCGVLNRVWTSACSTMRPWAMTDT